MSPDKFQALLASSDPKNRAVAMRGLAELLVNGECERDVMEGVSCLVTLGLDDPSPLVRKELASILCHAELIPYHLIYTLANDALEVAEPILKHCKLIRDEELIELIRDGEDEKAELIADREELSFQVTAAIAEHGSTSACNILISNEDARISNPAFSKLAERFHADTKLRNALLKRQDLPLRIRHALILEVSNRLVEFDNKGKDLPSSNQIRRVVQETSEQTSIEFVNRANAEDRVALMAQLSATKRLTPSMIVRALVSSNIVFVEEALSFLSGIPPRQVGKLIHRPYGAAFNALLIRAGIPTGLQQGFQVVVDVVLTNKHQGLDETIGSSQRKLLESIIRQYRAIVHAENDPMLNLLVRFALSAARNEARNEAQEMLVIQEQESTGSAIGTSIVAA